jgi:hypothetical protein
MAGIKIIAPTKVPTTNAIMVTLGNSCIMTIASLNVADIANLHKKQQGVGVMLARCQCFEAGGRQQSKCRKVIGIFYNMFWNLMSRCRCEILAKPRRKN